MKYKTEWNLGLLYKGDKDPQIEKDIQSIEKACNDFAKKYKTKDYTKDSKSLLSALKDFENVVEIFSNKNPYRYFALRTDLNADDSVAGALATKIESRTALADNTVTFFALRIGAVPKNLQKKFLNDPALARYRYKLKRIFDNAKYRLSEGEEKLENLLSQTSYTMWVDAQQRYLSKQQITFKGKNIAISQAMAMITELSKKDRDALSEKITSVVKSVSFLAEAEINAVYNYKKIMDEYRGFEKPYSSTVLGYENDEAEVLDLVTIVTKYFKLSHRFYKLHAKLLKQKDLTMADRGVRIGSIKKKFTFDSALEIVESTFNKIDPKYAQILRDYAANGQFDVAPKSGKKDGAYCWGEGLRETFVLLNHTDTIRSVETLAHEMGHAIHTELSKQQSPLYRKYSTATAEVASTFFEQAVMEDLEGQLTDDERLVLIHNKVLGDVTTVFRQIAFFNFELDLHNGIRKQGQLSQEEIASLLQKHLKAYTGPSMNVTKDDGYFFVQLSHIRRFFYVYSYAYGQLVSRALYENWKDNKTYSKKIEQFLAAGKSMSPKDIFKSIGINVNAAFFEAGLKGIERDIDKLEKLAKKQKKI